MEGITATLAFVASAAIIYVQLLCVQIVDITKPVVLASRDGIVAAKVYTIEAFEALELPARAENFKVATVVYFLELESNAAAFCARFKTIEPPVTGPLTDEDYGFCALRSNTTSLASKGLSLSHWITLFIITTFVVFVIVLALNR